MCCLYLAQDLALLCCCRCRVKLLSVRERKAVQGERSLDLSVVAWYPKSKCPCKMQLLEALLRREGEH